MKRSVVFGGLVLLALTEPVAGGAGAGGAGGGLAPQEFTEDEPLVIPAEELAAIAEDAWVWGFPLVLTEETRRQSTSVREPGEHRAPMGQFARATSFADPSTRLVVRPNVDTLYATAWVDLGDEPVVLHLPDTGGRYYVMPVLDAWTNAVASFGSRTTGTGEGDYALVGPRWRGDLPDDVVEVRSPTDLVWIIGRTAVLGPADLPAARAVQEGYRLTPLSTVEGRAKSEGAPEPTPPATRPPEQVVAQMDGATYFSTLAAALHANPPAPDDAPALRRFTAIGLVPGEPFDSTRLSEAAVTAVADAPVRGLARIAAHARQLGTVANRWTRAPPHTAAFGTDYDTRAAIALVGLGANRPEDATYYSVSTDATGAPLDGRAPYRVHFLPRQAPPNKAFWSLTLYDTDGFLVPNDLGRHALGSRDALVPNPDGSLDLLLQPTPPRGERAANWLPTPEGPFNLTLRVYWPGEAVLDGTWSPPTIERITGRGTR